MEYQTFSVEYTQRGENRFADALATLGSQIPFNGRDTLIKIGRQEHSIVRILRGCIPESPNYGTGGTKSKKR